LDFEAQSLISQRILERFPDHAIWAEEGDAAQVGASAPYTWIIDPIDGTNNYSRGHPMYSVSIALHHEDEVVLGAVYEPERDLLFLGQRGQGATVNGRPMRVSPQSDWSEAMVACDWARSDLTRSRVLRIVNEIVPEIHSFRTMGSAALGFCYVAAGWLEAYFSLHLSPWDLAAGALFVEEAGGRVTLPDGSPWRLYTGGMLASNGLVHEHLVQAASVAVE
jgi:myo-inositol-1(or 4)-monophosphatase